jgi:hypothetical protein
MRKYTKMHILIEESGSALSIDLATNQVDNWLFGQDVSTNYKTSDRCIIKFEQEGSTKLLTYSGYVPNCFPDKHYGDYLMLEIDAKGLIKKLNITDNDIDKLLGEAKRWQMGDYD